MGISARNSISIAFPFAIAALLLTGCEKPSPGGAGTDSGSGQHGVPPLGEVPKITTVVLAPVPVEGYLLTEEEWVELGKAESILRVQCMKRFGISYEEGAPISVKTAPGISQYRYGKLDPSVTAVYGYKNPGYRPSGPEADAAMRAVKEQYMKIGAKERMVLFGTESRAEKFGEGGQNYNRQTVPKGGCVGEAQRRLGSFGDAQVANDVNLDSFGKSVQDARVLTVFAKWSRCMEEQGYRYRTPIEASDDKRWLGGKASGQEKAVATADAKCKIKHNVAGVWYAVDVAYQKQAIEAHAEDLHHVRKAIDEQLKIAAEVLGR